MTEIRVFSFGTFLELAWYLQSTRSRRLLNGFWCFWCKTKLRVCLFRFFCFQHTFVETKATRTASEVKSCVFSLFSFQRCRQTWMCVYGTFLHGMYENNTQYRNVYKRILNTTVEACTHQISSQSEHYKKGHAGKNISPSEPRNQITYWGRRSGPKD